MLNGWLSSFLVNDGKAGTLGLKSQPRPTLLKEGIP